MGPKNNRFDRLRERKDKKIAFDVDGTLITGAGPRYKVIALMRYFIDEGYDLIVWSGGGIDYAQRWVEKLGFKDDVRVIAKGAERVNIAFDDQPCDLGNENIEV